MTVAKIISASLDNPGSKGVNTKNEMKPLMGIILVTKAFVAANVAALAQLSTWETGIKSKDVFPIVGLDNYEDQSSEDSIYESPLNGRKLTKRGQTRYSLQYDIPLNVHKALQSFNNADLLLFEVQDENQLVFCNKGETPKGFSLSMLNIGRMSRVPADASATAYTPILIDLKDSREFDKYGEVMVPGFELLDLQPLTDVVVEVVSAAATLVKVKVYSHGGYNDDGTEKEVAIKGIEQADFTTSFGTPAGFIDNGDGTYSFTGTGFTDGSVNLKAPSAMVSEGLLIQSTGPATIDIA